MCENISESGPSAFLTHKESRGYSRALGPATISSHTLTSCPDEQVFVILGKDSFPHALKAISRVKSQSPKKQHSPCEVSQGIWVFLHLLQQCSLKVQLSLLQNYKNAVTPAEAGVQKPLTSLDSCFRRNDRKKQVRHFRKRFSCPATDMQ